MTTWTVPAVVLRVIDADSLRMQLDLGWYTYRVENCRLGHCNAPELNTAAGRAARDFVLTLLTIGDPVTFTSKSLDKYGRPLGDITLADGRDLATILIQAGHAAPYEGGAR
ncbi:MAG TPA: thermonuclease family protein [Micromonosporaceae bacterium]|nr:thermonuclease family protein [Micromonosporaceae bacterium]